MANAGVVAVAFGILGAFGLITICGVRFVNMVGLMPFLSLGTPAYVHVFVSLYFKLLRVVIHSII